MDRTPESRDLLARVSKARAGSTSWPLRTSEQETQNAARPRPGARRWCACCRASRATWRAAAPTEVQVLVDGTNSNTASLVSAITQQVIAGYSRGRSHRQTRTANHHGAVRGPGSRRRWSRRRSRAQAAVWFNPDLYSRNYFVPGVVANIIMMVTLMLTALAIVREKEIGTMEQLMVTPMRPIELMLGKTLPFARGGADRSCW